MGVCGFRIRGSGFCVCIMHHGWLVCCDDGLTGCRIGVMKAGETRLAIAVSSSNFMDSMNAVHFAVEQLQNEALLDHQFIM